MLLLRAVESVCLRGIVSSSSGWYHVNVTGTGEPLCHSPFATYDLSQGSLLFAATTGVPYLNAGLLRGSVFAIPRKKTWDNGLAVRER
ncbi:hypothetical protein M0804_005115 [Polistes exclamans]|nr:hypothetical protein M0804_005115 [Polistes exclamans]